MTKMIIHGRGKEKERADIQIYMNIIREKAILLDAFFIR